MKGSIETLLRNPLGFLGGPAGDDGIVLSTRLRFARNLAGHRFPGALPPEERSAIGETVEAAVSAGTAPPKGRRTGAAAGRRKKAPGASAGSPDGELLVFEPGAMERIDREVLAERRLVTDELLRSPAGTMLLVRPDETVSITVNGEDHIRLQALRPGFRLAECLGELNRIDDLLAERLDYAFDDKLGYLTASPTNVGTGMRASAMLHLPGLVLSGQIAATVQGIGKLNLSVGGAFGDGTDNRGNLFVISNQSTLGESEEQILERLAAVIRQIVAQERLARAGLIEKDQNAIYDFVGRSYGVLRHSYCLGGAEAVKCLSGVRFGVDAGLFGSLTAARVNELLLAVGSAHLQKRAGRELSASERAARRAALCREMLKNA